MWFYGRLKGMDNDEVREEVFSLLDDVGLLHKRHEETRNLSGIHRFSPPIRQPYLMLNVHHVNWCLPARECFLDSLDYSSCCCFYSLL